MLIAGFAFWTLVAIYGGLLHLVGEPYVRTHLF